jgi:hypothetical protein
MACAAAQACVTYSEDRRPDDAGDDGSSSSLDAEASIETSTNDAPGDAAPPFCATVDASLCWSFDQTIPGFSPEYGPSLVPVSSGAPNEHTLVSGLSLPYAWQLKIGPLDASSYVGALHTASVVGPNVHCELDLDITTPGLATIGVFDFTTKRAAELVQLSLLRGAGSTVGARINIYGSSGVSSSSTVPVPIDAWFHVSFEIIGAGSATARAVLRMNTESREVQPDGGIATANEIRPILLAAANTGLWVVRYDNLVCRY